MRSALCYSSNLSRWKARLVLYYVQSYGVEKGQVWH
jgi:hypothetical protein